MGQQFDDLSKHIDLVKRRQDYLFGTTTPPRPHPDFVVYNLIITPQHGLCKIGAVTKKFNSNIYGIELMSKFSELEAALSEKYGRPERQDLLLPGSIWSEPQDWMTALGKRERILTAFWESTESRKLPDNIKTVRLETGALAATGYFSLNYEFTNALDCIEWAQKRKNTNL